MKWIVIVATASMGAFAVGNALAQEDLAKSSGCLNCHAVDAKKVGPSFKDIAAKYKGQAGADAKLAAEITGAKGHPKVTAKPDDVSALVKWVLAM